jgi:hypothetical protein
VNLIFRFLSLPVIAGLAMVSLPMFGQGTGSISGRVTDPSDAPISAATVMVTNRATEVVSNAATTSDGFYVIRFLPPGAYSVEASQKGFQRTIQADVIVDAASNPTVNLQLVVGSVSQAVTVSGTAAMIEAQTADRGAVVDAVRMANTPSQARNIMGLALSTAGTVATTAMKSFTPYDNSGSTSISISGGQIGNNEMLVDGVPNRISYPSALYGLIPTQESVQEMKVVTSPYSAEYGRTTGGVINVVTKSGANEFHGELFEYNRSTGLTANQFERNLAGQPRLGVHFNTPGAAVGGPIKRNKLFFFFETQRLHSTSPKSFIGQVPTDAERTGDFSSTFYDNGGQKALQVIYDPWTTAYNQQTGQFTRTAFPGNVIPAGRINPVAAAFWQYIPQPNAPGDPISRGNNYAPAGSSSALADLSEYSSRVDWNLSEMKRLSFRYIRNNFNSYDVAFYPGASDPNGSRPLTRANNNAVVDYTQTISPTSVVNFRVGMERYYTSSLNAKRADVTPSELGFGPTFISQAFPAFPVFGFGGSTLGSSVFTGAGSGAGSITPDQITNVDGLWSKTSGRHTIKVGGTGRLERYFALAPGNNAGNFQFSPTYTNLNPQVNTRATGNPVAAFLLGVGQASIDVNAAPARQNISTGFFVQDDINLTSKLKVNAGLRWDWNGGPTDRYNAMTGAFDTNAASPLAAQVKSAPGESNCPACANLAGGLTFPGVNGQSRTIYDSTYLNFGPRLGAAYSLDNKTVIRAGWGLFYGPNIYDPGQAGFSQTTTSVPFDANQLPLNLIDNPFPTGLIPAVGAGRGLLTNVGTSVSFVDPKAREPRSQQFSVDVQREMPWKVLLSAGYIYNGVSRLPVSRNLNFLSSEQLALGASILNRRVTNPFAGLAPGYALNQTTITTSSLLVPYPQFAGTFAGSPTGGITELDYSVGNSAYHGLQIQAVKRLSAGLSISIGYTLSKHMGRYNYQNSSDQALEKTIDPNDVPQMLTLNGVWQTPVGRGTPVGRDMPKWLDTIVGGWQLNWMIRLQEGMPYPLSPNAIPISGVDPNAVPGGQRLDQWINPAAFGLRTDPFALQEWSTISGRIRLPPINNFDLGTTKTIHITERWTFEFMTNWVNAFNTPQWFSAPSACNSPSASCFGKIANFQTQTNLPRQIQLAGRLKF